MPVHSARRLRLPLAVAATAGVLLGLQLQLLRRLDYSKGWLVSASEVELGSPTDAMALAGLGWDPAPFVAEPRLGYMRGLITEHCPGKQGFAAAVCLSDLFADRFPHGVPSREFFDRNFDVQAVSAAHLAGEPGHCVSRSGMLAAALLSSGTPARVVQIIPPPTSRGSGHTVVEVWQPGAGWVLFDPSFGGSLLREGKRASALALIVDGKVRWRQDGRRPPAVKPTGEHPRLVYETPQRSYVGGLLVFPDAWLYTRTGAPRVLPPFQGRYVLIGPSSGARHARHVVLYAGIGLTALALMVAAAVTTRRLTRPSDQAQVSVSRLADGSFAAGGP
jgi:hypothetical protein